MTTDGPFTEAKEVIGGFSIFNLASKEEALEEARKFTELHRVHWPNWEGEIEIRQMYEEADDVRAEQIEGSGVLDQADVCSAPSGQRDMRSAASISA